MQADLFESNDFCLDRESILKKNYSSVSFSKITFDTVRPFLRYPGSKYNAAKHILPFIQKVNFSEYREPFLGSGAIFFKLPKVEFSWLNDVDDGLINIFSIVADPKLRSELIDLIKKVIPTQKYFEELKQSIPKTAIEKAFWYFVINRTAYSGIMKQPNWGFHPTKSVQPDKWPERIESAGKKLEQQVKISNLHFNEVIIAPSKKNVFMYIDPPYFLADQKRAYFHSFTLKDHLDLLDALKSTNHKFCLTYDNCDEVKKIYSWANIHEIDWMYHTANSNVTTRKIGKELIITNY